MKRNLLIVLVMLLGISLHAQNTEEKENTTQAAFIYVAPGNDPKVHNVFIDSPVVKLTVVGVADYDQAEEAALELVKKGITAIELCAGFGNEGVARIIKAVGDKAVVGVVRFDFHPAFNFQSGDKVFK